MRSHLKVPARELFSVYLRKVSSYKYRAILANGLLNKRAAVRKVYNSSIHRTLNRSRSLVLLLYTFFSRNKLRYKLRNMAELPYCFASSSYAMDVSHFRCRLIGSEL